MPRWTSSGFDVGFPTLGGDGEGNMSDHELLQQYARENSQAAFTALVDRHVNLVYSAARRHVRSPQLAEEIAQSVFLDLSRHAAKFPASQPLAAWLYVVTRRTAVDVVRRESRRQAREQAAAEIAVMKNPPSTWPRVEQSLDDAMETLNDTERSAIILRFFENRPLREVGESLGLSEDTAQKRVSRALDRLRTFFASRGVAVGATTLAADLSAHAVQAAPAFLGANIVATATASTALQLATSHATTLTMTLLEKTILTAGLVLTVGGTLFEANALRAQRAELSSLRQRTDALVADTRQAQLHHDDAFRRASEARRRLAERSSITPDTASDLALKAAMTAWLDRVARFRQMATDHPELAIPEFQLLTDDDWFQVTRRIPPHIENNLRIEMSSLRSTAESKFGPKLRAALRAYLAANDDMLPTDSRQLAPFFDSPIAPATLDRYKMTAQGKISELSGAQRNALIEQRSPVDWEEDFVWRIGLSGEFPTAALGVAANDAIKAFTAANNGIPPTNAAQLLPYLPAPIDPARLVHYLAPR